MMSERDRRLPQPSAKKRAPLFDHLEDVDAPRLRSGPPSPLRDLLSDIDAELPVRAEPPRPVKLPPPVQRDQQARSSAVPQRPQPAPSPAPRGAQVPQREGPAPSHQTDTAARSRPVLRSAPLPPDEVEAVRGARRAYEDTERQVYYAEQIAAQPYARYASRSEPPIFSLDQPVLLVMIALVSVLIIAIFSGGNVARFSSWFPGGAALINDANDAPLSLALSRPAGDYNLQAAASIDSEQIDRILSSYGSPATGTGKVWYDLGQQYGIDPAFAVAFFIMESAAGTAPGWAGLKPDGSTTHNVGNIICAGYDRCHNRFRDYGSWEEGISDWYRLIDVEYIKGRGTITLQQIIPIYAPSFENDVDGYVNTVGRLVDGWRTNGVP